ncbi:hypothetical protein DUI87_31725 [Hirundo rustica rustica]|uniref:Uncharacterized protein n=1 Tax=Hirundo rustica rustica TaxID=333673 RepID=A0A3M0IYP7_HIRRU|nr:hypothetical protein DUI87_31725 [Hirundo rustica rustica]
MCNCWSKSRGGHGGAEGTGALPLWSQAGRAGAAQTGEEKIVWRTLSSCQGLRGCRETREGDSSGTGMTGQEEMGTNSEGKLTSDIEKKLFPGKVGRRWHRVPREAVAAPGSLAVSEARLNTGAWSNLG